MERHQRKLSQVVYKEDANRKQPVYIHIGAAAGAPELSSLLPVHAARSSLDMDGSSAAAVNTILEHLTSSQPGDQVTLEVVPQQVSSNSFNGFNSDDPFEGGDYPMHPRVSISDFISVGEGSAPSARTHEDGGSSGAVSPIPIESFGGHSRSPSQHANEQRMAGASFSEGARHLRTHSRSLHPPGNDTRVGGAAGVGGGKLLSPAQRRLSRHGRQKSSLSGVGGHAGFAFGTGQGRFHLLAPSSSDDDSPASASASSFVREADIDVQMVDADTPGPRAPANSIATNSPSRPSTASGGEIGSEKQPSPTTPSPGVKRERMHAWKFWKKVTSPPPPAEDVIMEHRTPPARGAAASPNDTTQLPQGGRHHIANTMPTQMPSRHLVVTAPGATAQRAFSTLLHIRKAQTMPAAAFATAATAATSPPNKCVSARFGSTSTLPGARSLAAFSVPMLSIATRTGGAAGGSSPGGGLRTPVTPKNKTPQRAPHTPVEEGRKGGHKRHKSLVSADVHSPRSPLAGGGGGGDVTSAAASVHSGVGGQSIAASVVASKAASAFKYLSPHATWRSLAPVNEGRRASMITEALAAAAPQSPPQASPPPPPSTPARGPSDGAAAEDESLRPPSPSTEINCYDDSVYEVPAAGPADLKSPRVVPVPGPTRARGVPVISSWTRATTNPHVLPLAPHLVHMAEKLPSCLPVPPPLTITSSQHVARPTMSSKAAALLGLAPPQMTSGSHSSAAAAATVATTATTATNSSFSSASSSLAGSGANSPLMRPLPIAVPRSASMIVVGSTGCTTRLTSPPGLVPSSPPGGGGSASTAGASGPYSELRSIISGHSPGYLIFLRHLQREYASESLLFWRAMEDFLPLAARDVEREVAAAEEADRFAAASATGAATATAATAAAAASSAVLSPSAPADPSPPSRPPAADPSCGFSLLFLSLWNMYIRPGSKFEINIASGLREKLKGVAREHEAKLEAARSARTANNAVPKPTLCLSHITPVPDDPADAQVALVANPLHVGSISNSRSSSSNNDRSPLQAHYFQSQSTSQTQLADQLGVSKFLQEAPVSKHPPSAIGQRSKSLFSKFLSVATTTTTTTTATTNNGGAAVELAPPSGSEPASPPSLRQTQSLPISAPSPSPATASDKRTHHHPSHSISDLVIAEMSLSEEVTPQPLSPIPTSPTSPRSGVGAFNPAMPPAAPAAPKGSLAWRTYQHLHECQRAIENLLVQDCLPRFKHSPLWAKYIAATGAATMALANWPADATSPMSSLPASTATSPIHSPRTSTSSSSSSSFATATLSSSMPTPSYASAMLIPLPAGGKKDVVLKASPNFDWTANRRLTILGGSLQVPPSRHIAVSADTFADARTRAHTHGFGLAK